MSETFVLQQRRPLRALLISSVGALVAAVLLVAGSALGWPRPVIVVAGCLLVLSILFGVLALLLTRRLDTTVVLDDVGYAIRRSRHRAEGPWDAVGRVTIDGVRLTLVNKADPQVGDSIVCLNGPDDPTLVSLMQAIRRRLNQDRGYHDLA